MKNENLDKVTEFLKNKQYRKQVMYIIVLVLFILFAGFSDYGLINTVRLQNRQSELREEYLRLEHEKDSLHRHIERLRYDTLYIERVAREKYGLIKPGEIIFSVEEDENK